MFWVYIEKVIFVSLDGSDMNKTIKELKYKNMKIDDQGHPADYVGVDINKLANTS